MNEDTFIIDDGGEMARPIEKRANIEAGVVKVVACKGLRGTTIQDIAAAAEVSPGLLYRYWKNRDDLAGDVYRTHYVALLERLAGTARGEARFWGRMEAMVRGFLEFADERPTVLKFLLLSQHDLHESVPVEQGVRSFVQGLIEEGMHSGEVREMEPALAIQLMLGMVLQPVVGALYGELEGKLSDRGGEIVGALRRGLAGGQGNEVTK